MPDFACLPTETEDGYCRVVIETPRGSHAKLDYDPTLGAFTLSKSLLAGLTYPHDWGFIPSTKADDGDPLDVMVIHNAATYPGLVLACRVIGILQINQKTTGRTIRNDRFFAVPRDSHEEKGLKDVRGLSKPIREELEKFFIATDELEEKKLQILEPIREVLESGESDVIHCWALDSRWSARCGSPNTAKLRTAVAFVTRAI